MIDTTYFYVLEFGSRSYLRGHRLISIQFYIQAPDWEEFCITTYLYCTTTYSQCPYHVSVPTFVL
jgi:hypothetical protein